MEQQNSFRKVVEWLTIISVPFALVNFTFTGIARGDVYKSEDMTFGVATYIMKKY